MTDRLLPEEMEEEECVEAAHEAIAKGDSYVVLSATPEGVRIVTGLHDPGQVLALMVAVSEWVREVADEYPQVGWMFAIQQAAELAAEMAESENGDGQKLVI